MVVAYTDEAGVSFGDLSNPVNVMNKRNTTVSIGCSCVLRQSDMIENYVQTMINKRSRMSLP
jgi:hypothetical protein